MKTDEIQLTHSCLIVTSADNLCKQFEPRSSLAKRRTQSGSKLLDTLMVIQKEFFEKGDFEKIQQTTKEHAQFPGRQRINPFLPNSFIHPS